MTVRGGAFGTRVLAGGKLEAGTSGVVAANTRPNRGWSVSLLVQTLDLPPKYQTMLEIVAAEVAG